MTLDIGHRGKQELLPSFADAAEELWTQAKYIRNCLQSKTEPKPARLALFEAAILEYTKASSKNHPVDDGLRLNSSSPLGCPDVERMGQFACSNRSRCWEPCGMLGHDERYCERVTP